jgi:hypothetical protein
MPLARTTKLQAVNTILSVLGESPVNTLDVSGNLTISNAQTFLEEHSRAVQTRGWSFNTDNEYLLARNVDNKIPVAGNILKVSPDGNDDDLDVVQVGDFLYDRKNRSFTFTQDVSCKVVWYREFEELPEAARRYIEICAARAAQERMLGSEALVKFTADDEARAMLEMVRAETQARNANVFRAPTVLNHLMFRKRRW